MVETEFTAQLDRIGHPRQEGVGPAVDDMTGERPRLDATADPGCGLEHRDTTGRCAIGAHGVREQRMGGGESGDTRADHDDMGTTGCGHRRGVTDRRRR